MCGRGNKGLLARGKLPFIGYNGGQYPFYLAPPKIPAPTCPVVRESAKLVRLNLGKIQQWIDASRLDPKKTITMHELVKSGLVSTSCIMRRGVRIVEENAHLLRSKIRIEATQIAPLAARAIEMNGGTPVSVWFSLENLRALIVPERLRLLPILRQPDIPEIVDYYADKKNRGYLGTNQQRTYPAPTATFFRGLKAPIFETHKPLPPMPITYKLAQARANINVERKTSLASAVRRAT